MTEKIKELRKKAMALPLQSGVYLMKNKDKEIIYVGKAKKLKNRVSSYFASQTNMQTKVRKMVSHVDDFDYIITDSEFEALVLECSLIKQHMPKYNILLKDDKGYHYIKVTTSPYPRIQFAMQKTDDGSTYIGPYTSAFIVREAVDAAQKIFKLPQCNKVFPRDIGKGRPCLNFHIGQCSAPCTGKISQKDYAKSVEDALSFLMKKGTDEAINEMKAEMLEASENLEFEKAAALRDRIAAIKRITDKQKVVSDGKTEQDVFAVSQTGDKTCLMVLRFEMGKLCDGEHFFLTDVEDLPMTRSESILSYYLVRDKIPPKILVDGEVEDEELIAEWLSEKRGRKVAIVHPQIGENAKLVEMCRANAAEKLAQSMGRKGKDVEALEELKGLLGIDCADYIESYDISHTFGADNVAGMIVFKDGVPFKKAYKRFAIKGFTGQDDYGSMAEVMRRRFTHYLEEKDSGEGFGKLPDLILLDGGDGQISAVKPVLEEFGLDIPLFGMVKDGKHRTRAIATGGREISISSNRKAFILVSDIQEEVHRFAISYHRQKHKKSTIATTLTRIETIGESKAKLLLKNFKTLTAIRNATVEELMSIKGINRVNAEKIVEYFRNEET
ncbi:MAG: excinuclease ABC subunit UvrC [Ruminococcaceae bacterium]|nr:excinuclease ABC subunit UvrC [Oscillospiraceae bacterium]